MTKEDLAALGVLGEKRLDEYGDRLIRQISAFVKKENLTEYVNSRPGKRAKQSADAPQKEQMKGPRRRLTLCETARERQRRVDSPVPACSRRAARAACSCRGSA